MLDRGLGSETIRRLLLLAQALSFVALLSGLWFFASTTGGTLFLFSAVAPGLITVAIALVGLVAFYHFRQQHRLFDILRFSADDVVVRQGDHGDCMYFVQAGELEVVRDGTVIATLSAGAYFGETALLHDEPRNATVRAVGSAQLASLGKANFLTMLRLLPATKDDVLATIQERAMEQD